jgi:hypothetical protein
MNLKWHYYQWRKCATRLERHEHETSCSRALKRWKPTRNRPAALKVNNPVTTASA